MHLDTANGPRGRPGSQRVHMQGCGGTNLDILLRARPMRAGTASRSVGVAWRTTLVTASSPARKRRVQNVGGEISRAKRRKTGGKKRAGGAPNSKLQASNSREASSTKLQEHSGTQVCELVLGVSS